MSGLTDLQAATATLQTLIPEVQAAFTSAAGDSDAAVEAAAQIVEAANTALQALLPAAPAPTGTGPAPAPTSPISTPSVVGRAVPGAPVKKS